MTSTIIDSALAREHKNLDLAMIFVDRSSAAPEAVSHLLRVQTRIDLLEELQREATAAEASATTDRDAGPRRPGDPIRHTGFDTEVPRLFHRIGLNPTSISHVIKAVKAQREALGDSDDFGLEGIYSIVIDDLKLLFQQAMSDAGHPADNCAQCARRYCMCPDRQR